MNHTIKEVVDNMVGITYDEAVAICNQHDLIYRTIHKDGVNYIVTMDLRLNRVNFCIIDNLIAKASLG